MKSSKKLSEVTVDDVKKILSPYNHILSGHIWSLKSDQDLYGEKCKIYQSKTNTFKFVFFDNKIELDNDDIDISVYANFDSNHKCYINAHKLGYYVENFSEFLK